jgi:iron-sulfur cluster repair protein YtfE (RIC family)
MPKSNEQEQKTISEFFEIDHREIDAIFDRVAFEKGAGAVPVFEEFDRRLERHIGWEEDILFLAVGKAAPQLEAGPLRVMRSEHKEIRSHKAGALAALRQGNADAARSAAERMKEVLTQHNMKEERILYPACDEVITPAERAELLSRLAMKVA